MAYAVDLGTTYVYDNSVSKEGHIKEINFYTNTDRKLLTIEKKDLIELIIDKDDDVVVIVGKNKNILKELNRYIFIDFKNNGESEDFYFKVELVFNEDRHGDVKKYILKNCVCYNYNEIGINEADIEKETWKIFQIIIRDEKKMSSADKAKEVGKMAGFILIGIATIAAYLSVSMAPVVLISLKILIALAVIGIYDRFKDILNLAKNTEYLGSNDSLEKKLEEFFGGIGNKIDSIVNSQHNLELKGESVGRQFAEYLRIFEAFAGIIFNISTFIPKNTTISSGLTKKINRWALKLSPKNAMVNFTIDRSSDVINVLALINFIKLSHLESDDNEVFLSKKKVDNEKRKNNITIKFNNEIMIVNSNIIDVEYRLISDRQFNNKAIDIKKIFIKLECTYSSDFDLKYRTIEFLDRLKALKDSKEQIDLEVEIETIAHKNQNCKPVIFKSKDIAVYNFYEDIENSYFDLILDIKKDDLKNVEYLNSMT